MIIIQHQISAVAQLSKNSQFDSRESLFGIIMVSADVEPLVKDTNLHQDFKWSIHLNELLKAPRSDDCVKIITIGQLKMVPRVFLKLVSHVLCPKNGGYSRIDNAEIHLIYIILNRIRINWAFTSCLRCLPSKNVTKELPFVMFL